MSLFKADGARPFGTGEITAADAIQDPELARTLVGYKRTVASAYRSLAVDELPEWLPAGPSLVSPKIDGQLWYLIFDAGEAILVNPRGRVIFGDIPVLDEARRIASRVEGRTVLAGELWAVPESGRVRAASLATAMGGGAQAQVKRIAFTVFDLVWGGDAEARSPLPVYADRLGVLQRVTEGGKRIKCVPTEQLDGAAAVARVYAEQVEGGRAEGLVVRAANLRTYKVKPLIHIDAVIVGYTGRVEDPTLVRSVLLALMRHDGTFQIIGSLGNMGGDDNRRMLLSRLRPLHTSSTYQHASRDGALYRFVKPELVVQFRINDVQSSDPRGEDVRRMVLSYEDDAWQSRRKMPGVAIYHPVYEMLREDKTVNTVDVRIDQLLERCVVDELDTAAEAAHLPKSHLLAREVYTKTTKGILSVRKLVAFKTNKEDVDSRYPAYVLHFTDYSPGRKDALQRTVRTAPTLEATQLAFETLLEEKKVKKGDVLTRGWSEVEGRRVSF